MNMKNSDNNTVRSYNKTYSKSYVLTIDSLTQFLIQNIPVYTHCSQSGGNKDSMLAVISANTGTLWH